MGAPSRDVAASSARGDAPIAEGLGRAAPRRWQAPWQMSHDAACGCVGGSRRGDAHWGSRTAAAAFAASSSRLGRRFAPKLPVQVLYEPARRRRRRRRREARREVRFGPGAGGRELHMCEIKSSSQNGHADFLLHAVRKDGAKDDVGVVVHGIIYDLRRRVDLLKSHVTSTLNIHHDALGAVDRELEQRRRNRRRRGVLSAARALARARTH
mmetsp:Transcript_18208/g.62617  ORF Transcript_18208/g.62617 Transcript_18208/m.62617 type:complete len:211 (+) Transcript_18208:34-666(+)